MNIKCFMLEPVDSHARSLRRYATVTDTPCTVPGYEKWYHNAMVPIEDGQGDGLSGDIFPHDDPRWPKQCACGYVFKDSDNWQLFTNQHYKRMDTGELVTLRNAPVGAMWYADWMSDRRQESKVTDRTYLGPDDKCLVVMTPGGEWMIDSRASNCTMPDDKMHKCWVRHGTPPDVHVDKNGLTCAAGAGSIMAGSYHGFLHNGYLEGC